MQMSKLEEQFWRFDAKNPHLYAAIRAKAEALLAAWRTRIGIAEIVEDLRYESSISTSGARFKIPNAYRAFYARKLIRDNPAFSGVIRLSRQTHASSFDRQDSDSTAVALA